MSAQEDQLKDILERLEDCLSISEKDGDGRLLHRDGPGSVEDVLSQFRIDLNATDDGGYSLLTIALINNASARVIEELLVRGASVATRDGRGRTPLRNYIDHLFCLFNKPDIDIVRLLLQYNADVNDVSFLRTPLHSFVQHRCCTYDMVELLLKYGADVTAEDMLRSTPLHLLLQQEDPDIETVRLLLQHNADVNAEDRHRKTPLLYSLEQRNCKPQVVELLLEYGANVKAKDFTKRTPIDFALKYGKVVCANLMIKYALINKYDGDWTKVIDIKLSTNNRRFAETVGFINQCVREIDEMKGHRVNDESSLYDWYHFVKRRLIPKPLPPTEMVSEGEIFKRYSVYGSTLWAAIKPCVVRTDLLNQLEELQSTQFCSKLGSDCLSKIVGYVPNNDLFNFIYALRQVAPELLVQ